jgi:hypothetical protein
MTELVGSTAVVLAALALAVLLALVATALVQVIRQPELTLFTRAGWVIVILVAPYVGSAVWFLFGHKTAAVENQAKLGWRKLR